MNSPSRNAATPAPAPSPVARRSTAKPQSTGQRPSGTPNSGQSQEQNSHSWDPTVASQPPTCALFVPSTLVRSTRGAERLMITSGRNPTSSSAPASNDSSNSDGSGGTGSFKFKKGDKLNALTTQRRPLLKVKDLLPASDEYMVWDRQFRFPLSREFVEANYDVIPNAPRF